MFVACSATTGTTSVRTRDRTKALVAAIDQIVFKEVSVFFESTPALRKFDATIAPGLTVLRGANGSGKSTLLHLLAGALRPTRGHIHFLAQGKLQPPPLASVLGHEAGLYPDLSARQNLRLFATYWGASASTADEQIDRFALGAFCDRPVRGFSQGQRQRTAIARAALADAPVLLLDEPTTGLDDEARKILYDYVAENRQQRRFVLWVTHEALHELSPDRELRLERGRAAPVKEQDRVD